MQTTTTELTLLPGDRVERLLLRVPEAAAALGVGRSTVYELLAAGELKSVHIGRAVRIPMVELKSWVERRAREAEGERLLSEGSYGR